MRMRFFGLCGQLSHRMGDLVVGVYATRGCSQIGGGTLDSLSALRCCTL
jgi:hypothetical protein